MINSKRLTKKQIIDFLNDHELDNVTDYTEDNKCSRCGNCCTNRLPMTKSEISRIKQYISKNNIRPVIHEPLITNVMVIDMMCPFYGNKKCTIYPVRPYVCKHFICNKKLQTDYNFKMVSKLEIYDVRQIFFGINK